jgi:adenosylcobinamide-GDP ribazoletransferase
MINDIKVAFAFLTRIPIGHKPEISIQRSAMWFPLVGSVLGLSSGLVFLAFNQIIPTLPAAAITILFSILVTGGFHQDGLADTFDGLVGGWTPEDRLRILKDSRHGTYGVLSIVMQSIIQVTLLASLDTRTGLLALLTAHTLGRLVPIYFMLTPAAPSHEGMGATYARSVKASHVAISTVLAIALLAPFIALHLLFVTVLVAIVSLAFLIYVRKKIGGVLGDVLGASEQIAESFILLYFVVIYTNNLWLSWLI